MSKTNDNRQLKRARIATFILVALVWLFLCWVVIASQPVITLWTLMVVAMSGIIVFVPLYKKYFKNGQQSKN